MGNALGATASCFPDRHKERILLAITCPKCGFEQAEGEECLRCGIIFRKYKPLSPPVQTTQPADMQTPAPPAGYEQPVQSNLTESPEPANPSKTQEPWVVLYEEQEGPRPSRGVLSTMFRIFPWLSLAATLGAMYLIFQQAPPIQIHMDPRALQRVDHKMEQLQIAAMTGQPYTLSLDEAELNAWLHANLALAQGNSANQVRGFAPPTNVPVDDPRYQEAQSAMKDLRVNLSGDVLRAYAVFDFHGRNLSLLLEGRVKVQDGYLRLEPTSARIGSLPIPKLTLDGVVKRLFNSSENRESFRVSPAISTVDIRHGRLFVAFR